MAHRSVCSPLGWSPSCLVLVAILTLFLVCPFRSVYAAEARSGANPPDGIELNADLGTSQTTASQSITDSCYPLVTEFEELNNLGLRSTLDPASWKISFERMRAAVDYKCEAVILDGKCFSTDAEAFLNQSPEVVKCMRALRRVAIAHSLGNCVDLDWVKPDNIDDLTKIAKSYQVNQLGQLYPVLENLKGAEIAAKILPCFDECMTATKIVLGLIPSSTQKASKNPLACESLKKIPKCALKSTGSGPSRSLGTEPAVGAAMLAGIVLVNNLL